MKELYPRYTLHLFSKEHNPVKLVRDWRKEEMHCRCFCMVLKTKIHWIRKLLCSRAIGPIIRLGWSDFEHRVALEKISWPELKSTAKSCHYRKIFLVWHMVKSQCVPQHNVFIFYFPIPALTRKVDTTMLVWRLLRKVNKSKLLVSGVYLRLHLARVSSPRLWST